VREIKFRAWGPNLKHMWEWDDLRGVSLDSLVLVGEKILMQYTGIKDADGSEIYESDLLQVDDLEPVEVFYCNGAFRTRLDGIDDSQPVLVSGRGSRLKKVGNIYENPELLNEDK